MNSPAPVMPDPADASDARQLTRGQRIVKELLAAPLSAKFGLVIIFVYVFVALFAPWIAPFGESEIVGKKYLVWDDTYLLGTDNLGRDMLTRLIYGARNTVGIALITTVYAFILGGILGIIAAVLGGWIDQLLSRSVDVLMAIPALIFHRYLNGTVDQLVVRMEEQALRLVEVMHGERERL